MRPKVGHVSGVCQLPGVRLVDLAAVGIRVTPRPPLVIVGHKVEATPPYHAIWSRTVENHCEKHRFHSLSLFIIALKFVFSNSHHPSIILQLDNLVKAFTVVLNKNILTMHYRPKLIYSCNRVISERNHLATSFTGVPLVGFIPLLVTALIIVSSQL